jgi:hypothetical protein
VPVSAVRTLAWPSTTRSSQKGYTPALGKVVFGSDVLIDSEFERW